MLALLFQLLPSSAALAGVPAPALTRFDLHHGHLFWAPHHRRMGLLLHAHEYPARCPDAFEHQLGFCQAGSTTRFDTAACDARNFVYFDSRVACLDASPASPLHGELLMEGVRELRTAQEGDFGRWLGDLSYFEELRGRRPAERLFVCAPCGS